MTTPNDGTANTPPPTPTLDLAAGQWHSYSSNALHLLGAGGTAPACPSFTAGHNPEPAGLVGDGLDILGDYIHLSSGIGVLAHGLVWHWTPFIFRGVDRSGDGIWGIPIKSGLRYNLDLRWRCAYQDDNDDTQWTHEQKTPLRLTTSGDYVASPEDALYHHTHLPPAQVAENQRRITALFRLLDTHHHDHADRGV